MSHRNENYWERYEEYEEPAYRFLRGADRINLLLSCAKNLEHLSLEVSDSHRFVDDTYGGRDDCRWLHNVLTGLYFPRLLSLRLRKFAPYEKTLHAVFRRHKTTLKSLVLEKLILSSDECMRVLSTLRNELTLSAAYILVGRMAGVLNPQYGTVVKDFGFRYARHKVDIGSYVIKPDMRLAAGEAGKP